MIMRNIALISVLLFIFLLVQSKHTRERDKSAASEMPTTAVGKIQIGSLALFILLWALLVIHVLVKG